ncbi:MAG: purine nucleoside phosphorylase DeoD-type [Cyclobacteriaceae bacterium]|nr:MAG: purine nucleoside phosphorylase DeoD-type [Cyclobacteriaceae bacterium]
MSIHIEAKPGEIAETVLLPGDPLRAEFVANNLLEDVICYNKVRGMLGYTGTYQGTRVSIQGTGMGIPSISIYVHELIQEYGVKNLIRVGTCGSIQKELDLGQVLLAMGACSDSMTNQLVFKELQYAPVADFELLMNAHQAAVSKGISCIVGNIYSTDLFYLEQPNRYDRLIEHGVLAVDMETSALYTLAAKARIRALSVLTVSDNIITGAMSSSQDRQEKFMNMMKVAMQAAAGI